MTPKAIRQVGQIRHEFYASFAEALDLPVSITKGESYSSNLPRIAWKDRSQKANYVCMYAHLAPDITRPEQPLILRIGVNQGLWMEFAKGKKGNQQNSQKTLQFQLTLLPDEVLAFIPWLISVFQAHNQSSDIIPPPYLLDYQTLDELMRFGAWTHRASQYVVQTASGENVL